MVLAERGERPGIAAVLRLLEDNDADVRYAASEALIYLGPKARGSVPDLVALFGGTKDDSLRANLLIGLGNLGPAAKAVVPLLAAAVKDKDQMVRRNAAEALGELGETAKAAVPALVEALEHKDVWTRLNVAEALGKIGPAARAAVPALTKMLREKFPRVQDAARLALKELEGQ